VRAVVLRKPKDLAVLDIPAPRIGPGWALVRMTHCGICGSDIRYLHGDNPWAKQTLGEKHPNPTNIILGHEVTGVVERVGEGCWADLIGKRVAILAFGTCGECIHCKRGEEHLCADTQHLGHGAGWGTSEYYHGGMAEYVPVYSKWLVPLPESITNEAGALLDPLGVAVHAVRKTGIQDGDVLLIIGGGAVGQLAIQVARSLAEVRVALVDLCEPVLEIARRMGADRALHSVKQDVRSAVMELSDGLGARAILDTVGVPLAEYLPMLARGGRYVTMTVTDEPQPFRTVALAGERALLSSCNFQYPDYHEALSLLEQRKVDGSPIITHRFPLDQAIEAFRAAEDKSASGAVKVLLSTDEHG